MLSALSAVHSVPHHLFGTAAPSYDRLSSGVSPNSLYSDFPVMDGKYMQNSVCSASSTKTRPFMASPGNMFRIFGYTPSEGAAGTPIVVTVQFLFESSETTFLRIVVGTRALSTAVRASASKRPGEWDLEAIAPDLDLASPGLLSSSRVPLTVQALNSVNATLDSLTFGDFTYTHRRPAPAPLVLCQNEGADRFHYSSPSAPDTPDFKPSSGVPSASPASLLARRSSRPGSGSGPTRSRSINAVNSRDVPSGRGQAKKQSLIRARRSTSEDDEADSTYRAVLSMETSTDKMAEVSDWDVDERRIGRRLVRFTRVQDGCTLHVVCEAIPASDYTEGDTVVSCIYRPAGSAAPGDAPASQCCITSVDIIFLLECLVGDIFNIEEKNRIRRNLEGFRPKTVSKNKVGTEEFFQKIMDFPAPKPRNIEKDVKVFDWSVLPQALDKIISKYTLYPSTKKQEGDATPSAPKSVSTSPHVSQPALQGSWSTSPSPAPDTVSTPSSDYLYPHTPYGTQYGSGTLDSLDNHYMSAPSLSCGGTYDSFLRPNSATPSPTPLHSSPSDSPATTGALPLPYSNPGDNYLESSPSLFASPFPDPNSYGSFAASYDSNELQRMKMSPSTDLQAPLAYL